MATVARRSLTMHPVEEVQATIACPLSPVAAAVRRGSKNKPNYAVVHSPDLCEGAVNGAMHRSSSSPAVSRRNSGTESTIAAASVALGPTATPKIVHRSPKFGQTNSKSELRKLTREEMEEQNQKAVEWFRNARSVNQRMRTVDDMECTVAEVRRLRAERALKEAEEAAALAAAAAATKSGNLVARRVGAGNLLKRPATIGDGPAVPALASGLKMSLLKGMAAKQESESSQAPGTAPEASDEPKKTNFLERFGYGTKPSENKFKIAAKAVHAAVKMQKASQFVGVSVGSDDLLDRLQARKEAAAQATKSQAKAKAR